MRFHVIGVGSIGTLVAYHLRKTLAPPHAIHLLTKRRSASIRNSTFQDQITVQRDGAVGRATGFLLEKVDPVEDLVYNLVENAPGQHERLPLQYLGMEHRRMPVSPSKHIDSLIVATKAPSTVEALSGILPRLTQASTIVLLQNGMGIYDELITRFFRNPMLRPHFILATTTHGAYTKQPWHIVHSGLGQLHFGIVPDPQERHFELSRWDPSVSPEERRLNLDDIARPLSSEEEADERAGQHPDARYRSLRNTIEVLSQLSFMRPQWEPFAALQTRLQRKLAVNACINPITALMQCRNGQLFSNPPAHALVQKVCKEAADVFQAIAPKVSRDYDPTLPQRDGRGQVEVLKAKRLEAEVNRIAQATAKNWSSMCIDLRKGNKTEIDYINGYLSKMGKQHGIATPSNDTCNFSSKFTPRLSIECGLGV